MGAQSLLLSTLEQCNLHPDFDDQSLFWTTFRKGIHDGNFTKQRAQLQQKQNQQQHLAAVKALPPLAIPQCSILSKELD